MTTVACFCLEKAGLLKRRQVVIEAICGCQRLCTKIIHRFRFFECHVVVFLNVLQCVVVLHLAKRVVQVSSPNLALAFFLSIMCAIGTAMMATRMKTTHGRKKIMRKPTNQWLR